jgi:transposase
MHSLDDIDFKSLAKRTKDHRLKLRLLTLSHFKNNKSRYQIAEYLQVSRTSVNKWISLFLNGGLDALQSKKSPGRPCRYTEEQQSQIYDYVMNYQNNAKGGRLTAEMLHRYIEQEMKLTYHPNTTYKILKKLGFSWITSRSKHPKYDEEKVKEFKKNKD